VSWIQSSDDEQERWVTPGIWAVKAHRIDEASVLLCQAAEALVRRGAKIIVMGCTEIPIALVGRDVGVALVDPTLALARACVAWAGAAAEQPGQTTAAAA
jgi:aspartate racemase